MQVYARSFKTYNAWNEYDWLIPSNCEEYWKFVIHTIRVLEKRAFCFHGFSNFLQHFALDLQLCFFYDFLCYEKKVRKKYILSKLQFFSASLFS